MQWVAAVPIPVVDRLAQLVLGSWLIFMAQSTPTNNPQPTFAEGDRVQERYGWPQHGRADVVGAESAAVKRTGRVIRVWPGLPNGKGEHGWQYDVQWDGDGFTAHGYIGTSLVRLAAGPAFVLPPVCLPGVRS